MYNNPYYNPYYQRYSQPTIPVNDFNGTQNTTQIATQNRQTLNGKMVDSVEVAKNSEYPLDGSVSYFPTIDGTAIVTKQLLTNGTSKTTIYKPIEEKDTPKVQYATIEDLKKSIKDIDLSDIDDMKEDIKEIKSEIKKIKKGD